MQEGLDLLPAHLLIGLGNRAPTASKPCGTDICFSLSPSKSHCMVSSDRPSPCRAAGTQTRIAPAIPSTDTADTTSRAPSDQQPLLLSRGCSTTGGLCVSWVSLAAPYVATSVVTGRVFSLLGCMAQASVYFRR